MLEAIRHAELGDDVYGEDPTVNKLEEMAAKRFGKEAALLVTSGTQANLVSLMCNAQRGETVILEAESHIYWYELGGVSAIAGLLPWPVTSQRGALNPRDVENAVKPLDLHFSRPTLVCVENTHNRHSGTVITPEEVKAVKKVAEKHGLRLYMDGARIFNAAVALGVDVKSFGDCVDNLMFCLSKGLCCPVGSVLVGSSAFIQKARRARKLLGGGMRQAGIIAAAGIVALEKMVDRLKEDHENAKLLAAGLAKLNGVKVDPETVQSNIVCFRVDGVGARNEEEFMKELKARGVLVSSFGGGKLRMVTHYGIAKEDVEYAVAAVESAVQKTFGKNV
jgi:threonine aldolase